MTKRRRDERGAALLIVLFALLVLLPLALGLSSLVLRRQRQVGRWQGTVAGRLAVEGLFDAARAEISTGAVALLPGQQLTRATEVGSRGVTLRVSRERDVALRFDGQIVPAPNAEFEERVIDAEGRVFCPWRRLEIYLVEAESDGTAASPPVRLLGGVARLEDGRTLSLGYRRDSRATGADGAVQP